MSDLRTKIMVTEYVTKEEVALFEKHFRNLNEYWGWLTDSFHLLKFVDHYDVHGSVYSRLTERYGEEVAKIVRKLNKIPPPTLQPFWDVNDHLKGSPKNKKFKFIAYMSNSSSPWNRIGFEMEGLIHYPFAISKGGNGVNVTFLKNGLSVGVFYLPIGKVKKGVKKMIALWDGEGKLPENYYEKLEDVVKELRND